MSDVRPNAVIFDLDGTLIDSLPESRFAVKSTFAECGLPYTALDLRSMIGPPDPYYPCAGSSDKRVRYAYAS